MKLASFIGGAFGTVGFGLSVLAGLAGGGNSVESILTKGLISAVICYVVGTFVGMMAEQVSKEHAGRIAKVVAEADAKAQQEAEEAEAQILVAQTEGDHAATAGSPN